MRDRLLGALDESEYIDNEVSKRGFLVYLMGPYKSYPPYGPLSLDIGGVATTRPTLDEIDERLSTGGVELNLDVDEALLLLVALKRDLRTKAGVNAFLATDPGIPVHDVDAATQSIAYAKAATATVFVAPAMGDNLGIGIETGSVCEHLDGTTLLDQLVFLSEENVESTMVEAVSDRWHVTTDEFQNYDDLYRAIRAHLRALA